MNRKLIREWRQFYAALIQFSPQLPETNFCKYFQTAIINTNSYSKNNLVESKIPNLVYEELASYKMINIVGIWSAKNSPHTNIRWASMKDRDALIKFLSEDHQKRSFGIDWSKEFDRRLKTWSNFKIEDYFIVQDPGDNNKIIAAGSVWNPIHSKQIIVPRIPTYIKLLAGIISILPGCKVRPVPHEMKPIEILYLNQISFSPNLDVNQRRKTLKNIIELIFSHKFGRVFNMLAYCDFERDNLLSNNKFFLSQSMSMALYTVHHKETGGIIQDELRLKEVEATPAFDIATV